MFKLKQAETEKRLLLGSFLLVLIFILLRLIIYFNYLRGWEVAFFSDNAVYAILAQRFLIGDFLGAIHPYWNPGFPLAILPFYLLSGSWEKAQIILSMLSATALILVMFLFLRRFSLLLALIAAFLTTFSITLQNLVLKEGITEPLYLIPTWLAILWGFLAVTKDKFYLYIFTGFCFALSYLIRTDVAGIYIVYMVFFVGYYFYRNKSGGFKKTLALLFLKMGVIVLVFFLVNVPYFAVLSHHLGKLTLSGKYANIAAPSPFTIYRLPDKSESTWAQDVWSVDYPNYKSPYYDSSRAMKHFLKNKDFFYWVNKTLMESFREYTAKRPNNFFVEWGLELSLLGLIFGMLQKQFRLTTIYFSVIWAGGLLWIALFMAPLHRYLVFILPFFIYLQALTVYTLAVFIPRYFNKLFNNRNLRFNSRLTFIVTVLILGVYFSQNIKNLDVFTLPQRMVNNQFPKVIGEWIKSQDIKVVAARYEGLGFYANTKTVYVPAAPPDELVSYLKYRHVEYLVLNEGETGYENVRPVADKRFQHPDLMFIKEFSDSTIVWKIR